MCLLNANITIIFNKTKSENSPFKFSIASLHGENELRYLIKVNGGMAIRAIKFEPIPDDFPVYSAVIIFCDSLSIASGQRTLVKFQPLSAYWAKCVLYKLSDRAIVALYMNKYIG